MKYSLMILSFLIVLSCEKEQLFNLDSKPIVAFTEAQNSLSVIADGTTHDYELHICVSNSELLSKETSISVLATIDHTKTTAIEGVHYKYTPKVLHLNYNNNFIKYIDIEILTDLEGPLSKELFFNLEKVNEEDELVLSSKSNLEINYDCSIDLTGTYKVDSEACDYSHFTNVTITKNEDGSWYMSDMSGGVLYSCTTVDSFNPGSFEVNCDKVEYSNNTAMFNYYEQISVEIGTIISGSWNQKTGVLKILHFQNSFDFLPKYYNVTYVRQN